MRHAFRYIGSFERNFPSLTTESTSFEGSDGQRYEYQPWPPAADGLLISYMEKTGKKFVAVRIADGKDDVVLQNEQILIPGQHFGYGVRLSGEPTSVEDDTTVLQLVEDIAKRNHAQGEPLLRIRARLKAAMAG